LSKAHVIVYSRPGCHLCDEAKQAIQRSGCANEFVVDEVNIETSDELLAKYRYDIPVITINGEEAFRHRVDATKFCVLIRESRS